ncbi:hypothetical protein GCM10023185_33180 [Hymenobacter saemangeumensis]|uniref:Nucleotidyltransferase n=1 Tax=Hymenobacter saemangeumensis TaxID=1084522 RepID=A0ABP8IN57_9BACT
METGSFGNGTGIRHFSDTDYFSRIPGAQLKADSGLALRQVKEALQGTFSATAGIAVRNPAVKIPFGKYAAETMEITPAKFLTVQAFGRRSFVVYQIPDGRGGWQLSSPEAHNYYVKSIDEQCRRRLKPLVRLIKAWNYRQRAGISSFYLELFITRYAHGVKTINYPVDFARVLALLQRKQLADLRDPMKISGLIAACPTPTKRQQALVKVKRAASQSKKAHAFAQANDAKKAFVEYKRLFKGAFPAF